MQVKSAAQSAKYGFTSLFTFVLTLLVWLAISTFLEPYIVNLSEPAERWLLIGMLVLPSLVGALLGAVGIIRRERKWLWAILGLILNALQVLHFSCVLAIAG